MTIEGRSWQDVFDELARRRFGATPEDVIEALLISPNARGYIFGAVSELLLARWLEGHGYHTQRIREKWEGDKLHHGDLYVSRDSTKWYVVESKGLKSNSEKWHKLALAGATVADVERWLSRRRRGEIGRWWSAQSADRRRAVLESAANFPNSRVLETHFVSGTGGRSGRAIATPRKDEFHVASLDLFLRTGVHEFIFAPAAALESPANHPDHLKQNYIIDLMIPGVDEQPLLPAPWTRDFDAVFASLAAPVRNGDMQVDDRVRGGRARDVVDLLARAADELDAEPYLEDE